MINSYPSIFNLGHAAIADLLKTPVIVEEKVDGSQISFGVRDGVLGMRSKGAELNLLAPEGMFQKAVEVVQGLAHKLRDGYIYRGEYLRSPKHNALAYDRVPTGHIIIFDVNTGLEEYLGPDEKRAAADRLDLECVPMLFRGIITDVEHFRTLLDRTSVLGGQKIEGVVIKPEGYSLFGRDKKALMGKFVSEAFREVHNKTWDSEHRTKGPTEIVGILREKFGTHARWNKALIHLKEAGKIEGDPRDIGMLMKEIPEDILKECREEIKDALFDWAWPQLRRAVCRGVPEWYKEELVKKQFES